MYRKQVDKSLTQICCHLRGTIRISIEHRKFPKTEDKLNVKKHTTAVKYFDEIIESSSIFCTSVKMEKMYELLSFEK